MSNTLSKSEILEGVAEVLADRLAVERDLIEEQASLIDNLDADSPGLSGYFIQSGTKIRH